MWDVATHKGLYKTSYMLQRCSSKGAEDYYGCKVQDLSTTLSDEIRDIISTIETQTTDMFKSAVIADHFLFHALLERTRNSTVAMHMQQPPSSCPRTNPSPMQQPTTKTSPTIIKYLTTRTITMVPPKRRATQPKRTTHGKNKSSSWMPMAYRSITNRAAGVKLNHSRQL